MEKKNILVLNPVEQDLMDIMSKKGYDVDFRPNIPKNETQEIIRSYDAVVIRSYPLNDIDISRTQGAKINAIARVGAGVNNIPVDMATDNGIVVFNAPGGNANAVAEETICGMIMAARNIPQALYWMKEQSSENIEAIVEKEKKQFNGTELRGKNLTVIGLGAIGTRVANLGIAIGMKVRGADPYISIDNAINLDPQCCRTESLDDAIGDADYISIHVPKTKETVSLINDKAFGSMKKGVVILNLARGGIIDYTTLGHYLDNRTIASYVTDFPHPSILGRNDVIALPHLGASTKEAGSNCADMIGIQLTDYLENGNITNSVNFPQYRLPKNSGPRICIVNRNRPGMIAQMTSMIGEYGLNISKMGNRSREGIAYNIIDIDKPKTANILDDLEEGLKKIDDIMLVRII